MTKDYLAIQTKQRARLYAAHQKSIDLYWDDAGNFTYPRNPEAHGGYRAILWQCLGYLAGDAHCVAKANAIILKNYMERPCHFTPGAALDVLFHHRSRLVPEAVARLERYLKLHVPHMSTEDLKIHGYNDNHPHKAIHALIVGGELLGNPRYVDIGLHKLRQAIDFFKRNGFPCEYNSPTYTVVSLNPLACIVEQAKNPEARELALRLEHFYWQDLALHFDPRAGVPAGPFSRAYVLDYSGLLSAALCLVAYLFPDRFDFDAIQENFEKGDSSNLLDNSTKSQLPFWLSHPVWLASPTYHLTPEIEEALFNKPEGTVIRGVIESGSTALDWKKDPAQKPAGAPEAHHMGPRRSSITTYFGKRHTLGTAQYPWLDNGQAKAFYATIAKSDKQGPQHAAIYYANMYFDEHSPYSEAPYSTSSFREEGNNRILQHEGTALVFYNPIPYSGAFKRLRTGVFRPLHFSRPSEIYVGETEVLDLNHVGDQLEPISLNEGSVYVGIIPLRLTDLGQARKCDLHIHDYGDHLAITMSSFEGWGPKAFTYEQIVATNAGFVFEIHSADQFASFAAFRKWLSQGRVDDTYYAEMRTTTYEREGLKLSACYGPYDTAFRYTSIDDAPVANPPLSIKGIDDPGYAFVLPEV